MSVDSDSIGMTAETGYELDETASPLRISGFLALICGLLGIFGAITSPMLGFCLAAIILGIFALRNSDSDEPPLGTTPARIGILLAILFGACGVSRVLSRTVIIGGQAEAFAREYLDLVARGEVYYAMELQKDHYNRYLESMPLDQYYNKTEEAMRSVQEFKEDGLTAAIIRIGPDANWERDRAIHVYSHYGRNMVDLVLRAQNPGDPAPVKVRMQLEFVFNQKDGAMEWRIDNTMFDRKRIVAEKIL